MSYFLNLKTLASFPIKATKAATMKHGYKALWSYQRNPSRLVCFLQEQLRDKVFRIENIVNKLGPSIVLDATANINEFYKIANRYFGFVGYVPAKQIRKYENMTIFKAKGYNQSRSVYTNVKKMKS